MRISALETMLVAQEHQYSGNLGDRSRIADALMQVAEMKDRILSVGKMSMTGHEAKCMAKHDVAQARLGATFVSGVSRHHVVPESELLFVHRRRQPDREHNVGRARCSKHVLHLLRKGPANVMTNADQS
jgi:hypothetical protein